MNKLNPISDGVHKALGTEPLYVPSEEALKFIAFIRATGNETNTSPEAHYKIADKLFSGDKKDWKIIIECLRGMGKLQTASSPILTPNGWTTMGEIKVGEQIITRSGVPAKVKWKTEPQHPTMYKMVLTDGTELKLGDEHLNIVERRTSVLDEATGKRKSVWKEQVINTKDLSEKSLVGKPKERKSSRAANQSYTTRIPLISSPVEFTSKKVSNDPYIFGLMLADGYFNKGILSLHSDDVDSTTTAILDAGYTINSCTKTSDNGYKMNIGSSSWSQYSDWVFNAKHVPTEYLYNSVDVRLAMLRGLMDGDGSLTSNGSSKYFSNNVNLANNVKELVQGLGGIAYVKTYERPDKDNGNPEYVVTVNMSICPFKMSRKADKWKPTTKQYRYVVSLTEYEETEEGYCIGVDSPCESYITENYTVTHNSTVVEYAGIYVSALGYWPGFGKTPFIVFLGASQEGNVKAFFKNMGGKIFASDFLQSLFQLEGKNYRQTDNEMILMNKDGVKTEFAGRGMNVNWRGIRSSSGHRPTVLIADDVLSNDVMTSEAIRQTVDTNWFNSALPALDTMKHKIIYVGTPLNEEDLMHKLKRSGVYTLIQFPLCSNFPCAEEDFDSVWSDRFTYEYTREMYQQFEGAGKVQSFYQEYMLQITDLSTLLVEEEDIKWFDKDLLLKHKSRYNFYIVTDFATSTNKKADFSTIGVIAISSNGDWLLVDGQCIRQSMQENLDDLFKYVSEWRPVSVGIETNGQQGGFISILEEMMMSRNVWFQLGRRKGSKEAGIRAHADKLRRFVTGVQPMFKQGKVWLPKVSGTRGDSAKLKVLVDEMTSELSKLTSAGGVKALPHDDAIDLLNQLSEMDTYNPSEDTIALDIATARNNHFWGDEEDDDRDQYKNSTVF